MARYSPRPVPLTQSIALIGCGVIIVVFVTVAAHVYRRFTAVPEAALVLSVLRQRLLLSGQRANNVRTVDAALSGHQQGVRRDAVSKCPDTSPSRQRFARSLI